MKYDPCIRRGSYTNTGNSGALHCESGQKGGREGKVKQVVTWRWDLSLTGMPARSGEIKH